MTEVNPILESSWKEALKEEFNSSYFKELREFLINEKKFYKIFPDGPNIFNALNYTPLQKVKVVIIGQDPYHGAGQAHGLCFSVPQGVQAPPSLRNIIKEINSDIGTSISGTNLENWAKQGVLLLNAVLTVREGQAGSHQNKGWEKFTDAIIKAVSENNKDVVFLLWGRYAHAKEALIDQSKHHILKAAHPSPLSAFNGFFGCKHFSKTNEILRKTGQTEINWSLS